MKVVCCHGSLFEEDISYNHQFLAGGRGVGDCYSDIISLEFHFCARKVLPGRRSCTEKAIANAENDLSFSRDVD